MSRMVVVTGGTGFIGRHLLADLAREGGPVRALTRRTPAFAPGGGVEWVVGDLGQTQTWRHLLEPGCTVFHLAHSNADVTQDTLEATRVMVQACADVDAARLVHCSTVSVFGRATMRVLTESSACHPVNDYGRIKHAVEQIVLATPRTRMSVVVARPTVVFGQGGDALRPLLQSLRSGRSLRNYLRASLFGTRHTHLVPVQNVVAALRFLADAGPDVDGQIFNVSSDDEPLNNFRDVERILRESLGMPSAWPLLPLPRLLLEALLHLRGRQNTDTRLHYSADKLRRAGFWAPLALEPALRQWVQTEQHDRGGT